MKFTFDFPTGQFAKALAESKSAAARRVTGATRQAADALQDALRQQVRSAALGGGLDKAWRLDHFPGGDRASLHPASLVYSKATALHRAYGQGATIRARGGTWLAIPLPGAIERGWDRALVDRKGGGLTGAAMPRRFAQTATAAKALGGLRFVPIDDGRAILVADPPKSGRGRARGRRPAAHRLTANERLVAGEALALFLLVRQVRVRKSLDFEGATKAAGTRFNALLRAAVGQAPVGAA